MTARLPPREKGANACTIGYDMLARVFFALFFGYADLKGVQIMTPEACIKMSREAGVAATLKQFGEIPRVRLPMSGDFLARSIEDFPLSVRSRNALMRAGLYTVDKLTDFIQANGGLNGIRNLGKVSIQEIKLTLTEAAYELLTERERVEFWEYALNS